MNWSPWVFLWQPARWKLVCFCHSDPGKLWYWTVYFAATQRKLRAGKGSNRRNHLHRDFELADELCVHRQPFQRAKWSTAGDLGHHGLLSNTPGYIKNRSNNYGGQNRSERYHHLGVQKIKEFSEESCVVTPLMPFITSYFMLRELVDRPLVIPNGSENLALHPAALLKPNVILINDRVFSSNSDGSCLHS